MPIIDKRSLNLAERLVASLILTYWGVLFSSCVLTENMESLPLGTGLTSLFIM